MTAKPTPLGGSKPLLAGSALGIPQTAFTAYSANFPVGSWTFTAPAPGAYKFVMWGAGALGTNIVNSGGSGAYSEYTRNLGYGETVALVVGEASGADTTATFRDGKIVTAGKAAGVTAGVASGGDVNLAGSAGLPHGAVNGNPGQGSGGGLGGTTTGTAAGGAGAPGVLPYRGANGESEAAHRTYTPGAGGASQTETFGGDGMIIVTKVG